VWPSCGIDAKPRLCLARPGRLAVVIDDLAELHGRHRVSWKCRTG